MMKKFMITTALALFTISMLTSCEPDTDKDQLANEFSIDKEDQSNPGSTSGEDPVDNGEG